MSAHIAKARVVKVAVGSDRGHRVARILFAGDIVPDGVADEQLARLLERGLIEKVAEESTEVELPEGAPTERWTAPQLKKYAETHSVDLGGAKNKPEVLAIVVEHAAKQSAPAGD